MVRQAVRQAHGPEQNRRTHHPEPTCREPLGRTTSAGGSGFRTDGGFSVQICASMFLFPDTRNLTPETLRFGAGGVSGHLKAGYPWL